MFIRSNALALTACRNWNNHNNSIAKSLERLSTGLRINRAADDPAGLAISEKFKAQLTILQTDQYNVSMQMSMINTTDQLMAETSKMLDRMLELANISATGTLSDVERHNLDAEYQQLMDEINRVSKGSTFNSVNLFENMTGPEQVSEAVDAGDAGVIFSFSGQNLNAYLDGLDSFLGEIATASSAGDQDALLALGIDTSNGRTNSENLRLAVVNFTREHASELLNTPDDSPAQQNGKYTITLGSGGDIVIDMPSMSEDSLQLNDTNLLTQDGAQKAMDAVKNAINSVSSQRGSLGAAYNRLEHTMSSLANMEENLTDALSRITDTDMAKEMMNLVREQILAQTSMFAMAQARQQPEQVLELIKSM